MCSQAIKETRRLVRGVASLHLRCGMLFWNQTLQLIGESPAFAGAAGPLFENQR
jgi:hypothetical protein